MLMQRPARSPFLLAYFSFCHYSVTDRLTAFFFPSSLCTCLFGLHLQDNFRVSALARSLFLLLTLMSRFHLFLFFLLSVSFHEVCFAQGYISLSPLRWFLENPLLFIIVLLWKLAIKIDTLQNYSYLQRRSKQYPKPMPNSSATIHPSLFKGREELSM